MADADRKHLDDLTRRLRDQPWLFAFFQIVRLARLLKKARGVPKDRRDNECFTRFRTAVTSTFPDGSQSSVDGLDDDKPRNASPVNMTVALLGLTTPSGVLPRHYTDLIVEREGLGDTALHVFLDMFNDRLIELFYAGWEKTQFHLRFERGDQAGLMAYLLAMAGLGTPGLGSRLDVGPEGVSDLSLAFFAGLLGQTPRPPVNLEQILRDLIGCPVEVCEFHGRWLLVPDRHRTRLRTSAKPGSAVPAVGGLGQGIVLGHRVWDRQSTLIVRIGPVDRLAFAKFLPRGRGECVQEQPIMQALTGFLSYYLRAGLDVRIQLLVVRRAVPVPCLRFRAEGVPVVLGLSSWLRSPEGTPPRTCTIGPAILCESAIR